MAHEMTPFYSAMLLGDSPSPTATAGFKVIKELSREEYDKYADAYHLLQRLLHTGIYTYVKQTLKDLVHAMEQDAEEMLSGSVDLTQPHDLTRMGIRMRGAVLTFCSALHIHQEHINHEVIEKFGENSPTHKKVRKVFTRLYDKSFAYRVLWHTRNTMVHHTLETVAISMTAFLDEHRERQALSMPRIDLSAIIDLNDRISSSFRLELQAVDENPFVLELLNDAMPLVLDANRRINKHLYPNLKEICQIVREFDDIFEGRDGVRCLTSERTVDDPPPLKFSHTAWSGDAIMFARGHGVATGTAGDADGITRE